MHHLVNKALQLSVMSADSFRGRDILSEIRIFELQINNSLDMTRQYAWIFDRGYYLFQDANSFKRAKLIENCKQNRGYLVHYPSNILQRA